MSHKEITEKQESYWLAAALMAPLAQTASECSWPVVVLLGGACLLICWGLGKFPAERPRWQIILQGIWNCVVISEILHWSLYCWQDQRGAYAIPLTLLLLSTWAASGPGRAARTCCVLLWPLSLLLGAVLLSGVPEIQWRNLKPTWQMPDANLITVALIPALSAAGKGKKKGRLLWGTGVFALVTAAVTSGVLSPSVIAEEQSPIYELCCSLGLFGAGKRLESVIAAAMTMGYFAVVTYLISIGGNAAEGKKAVWLMAAVSLLLLLSRLRLDSRLLALGSILTWVVLPAASGLKKNFQKRKKGVDK